jgi:hypothetical protein
MKKELTPEQKEAKRLYLIEWRKNNSDKVKTHNEKQKEYAKEWKKKDYDENKENRKANRLKYYHDNAEIMRTKQKEYKKNNRPKLAEYQRNYYNTRKKNDIVFKVQQSIRSLIKVSLMNKGIKKNSKTEQILGCTFQEFKQYLESKFESWMSWDNYGLYNGQPEYGWDIDHIIPNSKGKTKEDVIRLNHYSNLQPLCSHINRNIKKDRVD